MVCIYCGFDTNDEDECPYCRKDLRVYKRILIASDCAYNEGIKRARVRDLTGAIDSLNRSLKMNKYHIEARNLLGLVYFEVGDMVLALREWVISKNFKPDKNRADYYLEELQRGQMDKLDQITKKYNLAIDYCRLGDYDLAKIQLKSVLSKNSSMIHAYQLLALLYLNEGNPEAAKKQLTAASKIDVKNPTTLTYLQEAEEAIRIKKENKRKRRRNDNEAFTDAEDVGASGRRAFTETIDNSKGSIFNVIIGIVIGILVSIFLILPTMRQDATQDTVDALINANEEAAGAENNIASLKDEIESLKNKLSEYEGQSDVKGGYEQLLVAMNALQEEDWDEATKSFDMINRDLLDPGGAKIYDDMSASINDYRLTNDYDMAKSLVGEENYEEAIKYLTAVVEIDEKYDNGNAIFTLGQMYQNIEDSENAIATFERVKELYKGRRLEDMANKQLEELEKETRVRN